MTTPSEDPLIFGVMSDTHGNRKLMMRAAELMRDMFEASAIYHLGDDYADAAALKLYGYEVHMVPGLWCPEYRNPRIPNRVIEKVRGLSIAYAHADKDLRFPEHAASIIMTGHTHVAEIAHIGLSVHLNPGHLKSLDDRGQAPSFAIVRISSEDVHFAIHEITGGLRAELNLSRSKLA